MGRAKQTARISTGGLNLRRYVKDGPFKPHPPEPASLGIHASNLPFPVVVLHQHYYVTKCDGAPPYLVYSAPLPDNPALVCSEQLTPQEASEKQLTLARIVRELDASEAIASQLPCVTFEGRPIDIRYSPIHASSLESPEALAEYLTEEWRSTVFESVGEALPEDCQLPDYVVRLAENLLASREESSVEAAVTKAIASSAGWLARAKDYVVQLEADEALIRRMVADHTSTAGDAPAEIEKGALVGVSLEHGVLHRLRHEIRTDEYVAYSYDTDPAAVQQAIAHIIVEQAERAALERERAKKAAERAEMLARPAACCVCGANEADGAEFSNSQKVRFKLAKCKQCIEGAQEQQKRDAKEAREAKKARGEEDASKQNAHNEEVKEAKESKKAKKRAAHEARMAEEKAAKAAKEANKAAKRAAHEAGAVNKKQKFGNSASVNHW